ncbi:hypothetical protein CK203_071530 [Vitis vinifera]|uniref:Uncharacterized protein n=1 Tax=Vitis vinifera TaxID=29760 RepID=A0A438F4U8_VITVI|nr:hypothetical protein CK203_071530 [Vitis vinifera]
MWITSWLPTDFAFRVRGKGFFILSSHFLLQAYSDMIAERRKKVTSGVEDTFGLKKSQ